MQVNVKALSKKAIDAALNQEWESAVDLNEEILGKVPNDKDAKTRLGRAYLKTKSYSKAKKIFKEILDEDPINKIALKNFKLASEKKDDINTGKDITRSSKAYIKEPGTSLQVEVVIKDKRAAKNIELGQTLDIKSTKHKALVIIHENGKEIGELETELSETIYEASKKGAEINSKVIRVKEESVLLTLISKHPIFKSEKQQEKPFMKVDLEEESDTPDMESMEPDNS